MSHGQYFPPYTESEVFKVKLGLSNNATKIDLKNVTHVDASSFALKTNLNDFKKKLINLILIK